jgi:hypothetical protein
MRVAMTTEVGSVVFCLFYSYLTEEQLSHDQCIKHLSCLWQADHFQ